MSDNADNPDRPANVVTIRPDGTGLMYLTDNRTPDQRAFAGGYSPDGKWIVYRQEIGDQAALMVMRTEGQGGRDPPVLGLPCALHRLGPRSELKPSSRLGLTSAVH